MADQENQENDQTQNPNMNIPPVDPKPEEPVESMQDKPSVDPEVMAPPPGESIAEKTVLDGATPSLGNAGSSEKHSQVSSTGGSGQIASGEGKEPVSPASADYTKFVKSSKSKYALWVIIVGIILLVASGIGYYLAVYGFELPGNLIPKQDPVVQQPVSETEPIVAEEPEAIIEEEVSIENDEQIMMFDELESSSASSLSQMESELENVDYEGIDTGLQQSDF